MTGPDPAEFGWWLASRAAGVVALLCIAVSVGVGLAMAGRLSPALARTLLSVHQQTALVGLVAIAVHGITLLGDRFLDAVDRRHRRPVHDRPRAAVDRARRRPAAGSPRSSA